MFTRPGRLLGEPVSTTRRRVSPDLPGQSIVVSLPVGEQRVLDGIESALEGDESQLRSMFAIFTRLTQDDGRQPRR